MSRPHPGRAGRARLRHRRPAAPRRRAGAPEVKRRGGILLVLVGARMLPLAPFADFFAGLFPV